MSDFRRQRGGRRQVGPYGYEHPDPAPDVCTVAREADGSFLVRHYPNLESRHMCCRPVQVHPRAGESEIEALARADRIIDAQHAPAAEVA